LAVPAAAGVWEPPSAAAARASDVARALIAYRSPEIELSSAGLVVAVGAVRGAFDAPVTKLPGNDEAGLAAELGCAAGALDGWRTGVICCT
jgi:hypothetical protein